MKLKATLLSLTLLSAGAMAGFINHYPVTVNTAFTTAYGSMIGARQSADSMQFIGCSYVGTSSNPYGICHARDASGTNAYCTTTNSHHIDQIRGLSNESYLYYQWDASTGRCSYIYSSTSSAYHQ